MERPAPTAMDPERPTALGLAAVALGCALAGVGLARWTLAEAPPVHHLPAPPPDAPPASPVPLAATDPSTAPGATEPSLDIAPASAPNGDVPDPSATPAPPDPDLAPPGPAPPATREPDAPYPLGPRRVRIAPGRMAYLRCDGAEIPDQPYPCPRDEALELGAWARIGRLPTCATFPEAPGELDVRLEFRGPAQVGLSFRSSEGLDRDAVSGCLAELRALTTTVPGDRTIASFRFEIVPLAPAPAP